MKYISYIFSIIIVAFWGCKTPKIATLPTAPALPDSFESKPDTSANIAQLPWKAFFPDTSLCKLIDTALIYNPDLLVANQKIQIAGAYLQMAKGALLPSLTFDVNASGTHYGKYTMDGVGNYDTNLSDNITDDQKINEHFSPNYWLGFNSSWEADLWGKLRNKKKAELSKYLASSEGKNLIQTILISQVAGLYYTLQGLDKEKNILEQNEELQQKALDNVKALMDGGRATQLAIQQFQGQLLNTQASQTTIDQKIKATENQLNALIGTFGKKIDRDTAFLQNEKMAKISIGFPSELLQNRPDIKSALYNLESAKANVKSAKAAFLPSFKVDAFAAFNAFNGSFLFNGKSIAYSLAGGLSAPIFLKNQLKANFNVATAEQQSAFYEFQKSTLNAYQEVATSFNNMETNKKIMVQKSQEVKALQDGVVSANDLYFGGYAGYLEIISAQKSMLQAQLELVNKQKDIMLSIVDIYRSVGGGWK